MATGISFHYRSFLVHLVFRLPWTTTAVPPLEMRICMASVSGLYFIPSGYRALAAVICRFRDAAAAAATNVRRRYAPKPGNKFDVMAARSGLFCFAVAVFIPIPVQTAPAENTTLDICILDSCASDTLFIPYQVFHQPTSCACERRNRYPSPYSAVGRAWIQVVLLGGKPSDGKHPGRNVKNSDPVLSPGVSNECYAICQYRHQLLYDPRFWVFPRQGRYAPVVRAEPGEETEGVNR
jgi:hypothetical protein